MKLPLISAGFTAFALISYVVLDGFDLGVGILLFFERAKASRDHMIDSITPTCDGNETWLIMAGVMLLACFPIAYGILMPALYVPVIVLLLSLGLRGVSFEFRMQSKQYRERWDKVFAVGSAVAAFMQGLILGTVLDGITIEGTHFAGSVLDILRPLPLLSGLTLVVGYTVLGSGSLRFKGNASIQSFSTRRLRSSSIVFGALFCLSSSYAYRNTPEIVIAWSDHPMFLSSLACLFVALPGCILAAARKARPLLPFVLGIGQFLTGMAGIALIVYPNIVPFRVSIWDAASPDSSQMFVLIGVGLVAPVVIAYSSFAYWVFRGKTPAKGWEG